MEHKSEPEQRTAMQAAAAWRLTMVTKAWQTRDGTSMVEAVAALLSAGDTGHTTDEITDALDLPIDGAALQSELEEMVVRGILARRGIGRGALYTLTMLVPTTGDASDHGGMRRKGLTSHKAG